jgi:hypothetical protein
MCTLMLIASSNAGTEFGKSSMAWVIHRRSRHMHHLRGWPAPKRAESGQHATVMRSEGAGGCMPNVAANVPVCKWW